MQESGQAARIMREKEKNKEASIEEVCMNWVYSVQYVRTASKSETPIYTTRYSSTHQHIRYYRVSV